MRGEDLALAMNARPRTLRDRLKELKDAGQLVVSKRGVGISQRWGLPEQIPLLDQQGADARRKLPNTSTENRSQTTEDDE